MTQKDNPPEKIRIQSIHELKSNFDPTALARFLSSALLLTAPRLFATGTLYELRQNLTVRLEWQPALQDQIVKKFRLNPVPIPEKLLVMNSLAGAYRMLSLTFPIAVGWVYVSARPDGMFLERWLLLHEIERPLVNPLTIVPVPTLPNGHAPTDGEDFAAQAKLIFEARKASPPAGGDFTRYVRAVKASVVHSGPPSSASTLDWMPQAMPSRPAAPGPAGNGTWNGQPEPEGGQIDDGTVGIFRNGSLAGVVLEAPVGHTGTTTTLLSASYQPPTQTEPIVLSNLNEVVSADLLALSDDEGSGTRRWRLELASNTFYSETFPAQG